MTETILDALETKRGFRLEHEGDPETFDAVSATSHPISHVVAVEPLTDEEEVARLRRLLGLEARLVTTVLQDANRLRAAVPTEEGASFVDDAAAFFQASAVAPSIGQDVYHEWLRKLGFKGRSGLRGVLEQHRELLLTTTSSVLREYESLRADLVEGNARMVDFAIRKHATGMRGDPLAFLHGLEGLGHAVDLFRFDGGAKLSTYSVWWIRQRVTRYALERAPLRWPVHWTERVRRIDRGEGSESDLEKRRRYGLPARNAWFWPSTTSSAAAFALFDPRVSTAARREARVGLSKALRTALAELTERRTDIIERRYGLWGHRRETLESISDSHDVTRERIRQLEAMILERWRSTPLRALQQQLQALLEHRPASATNSTAPSSEC